MFSCNELKVDQNLEINIKYQFLPMVKWKEKEYVDSLRVQKVNRKQINIFRFSKEKEYYILNMTEN